MVLVINNKVYGSFWMYIIYMYSNIRTVFIKKEKKRKMIRRALYYWGDLRVIVSLLL